MSESKNVETTAAGYKSSYIQGAPLSKKQLKMNKKFFIFLFFFIIFVVSTLWSFSILAQHDENVSVHSYYGYVPSSTDVGAVQETIGGKVINYSVPAGCAVLDVIGYYNNTEVKLYDLLSGKILNSTTVNYMEKVTFFIPYGTYFKLVSSSRIGAAISGGAYLGSSGYYQGIATFYPAIDGGFRGTRFIFAPLSPTWGWQVEAYNFHLFALENTKFTLLDSIKKFSTSEALDQRATYSLPLQSRIAQYAQNIGVGYSRIFQLTATSDVMICSLGFGQVVYVPAITGGYVGKVFYASDNAKLQNPRETAVIVVVPLEPGKVTIYDNSLTLLAEHTFTEADVSSNAYWFKSFSSATYDFIVKSTGNITLLVGQVRGDIISEYLIGDGVTFLGSRPNQEVKFFAPSSAIVFSVENQSATIDGELKSLKRDDVIQLGSGVHTIKGTGHLIVQVLASGSSAPPAGWNKWGSYLIEPLDVDKDFSDIPSLTQAFSYFLLVGLILILLIVIALAYFFILRKKKIKK